MSPARIAALVVALLASIVAVLPAQAAAPTTATAGTTWAQLMRQKLTLDAESVRLTKLLPTLRAAVTTRDADLALTRQAQTAAATAQTAAATADEIAHLRHATARTAAAAARQAVTAAQRVRPRNPGRVARAKRALTTANATVQARAVTAGRTASAVRAARAAYTEATGQVAAATTAHQVATGAVAGTRQRIAALPQLSATLVAQAAAVSAQAVMQTRASFTITQTTQVYGVTVNKIVALPFQRMIDDAARAGISLSGGGFRTRQQQIALRTANRCPDIWKAPASSCKVPTAIPGRSLHELGLAIDLTSGARSITDRRSAAFKWLAANAGGYGFVNLPSEPWHWSITGN